MYSYSRNVLYWLTTILLVFVHESMAGTYESISINPYGLYIEGAAYFKGGYGPYAGIVLPGSELSSSFAFGFTLTRQPIDTDINIMLTYHVNDANCDVELRPNFISVARPYEGHIIGAGASTGLSALGGGRYVWEENLPMQYWFTVSAPDGGYLESGDVINVGIYRTPLSLSDTCEGNLIIQGIDISYNTW